MSTADSLTLFDEIAEQCYCSLCNGYLSCGPIRVLPDGSSICGHCTPANPDTSLYRDLVLEKVLSKISFPCRFKQYGCSERILFGQETDHESRCSYRLFACPVSAANCHWEGFGSKLLDHFTEKHSELIKENIEIKLQIAQFAQGIFMVVKGSITIVIKYLYDSADSTLKYDIRYCANHSKYDVSSKIQLINDLDFEYNINLKSKNCAPIDDTFYGKQNESFLNLKKFYECLDYPDCIRVIMNLTVVQTGVNTPPLDSLRCVKCFNYLIPPLYDLDEVVVCCDCGKDNPNCTPTNDQDLERLVNEIKFPCRWKNCHAMLKSDVYKMHERSCEFYIHECVFDKCHYRFKLSDAVAHYQEHKTEYFTDQIVFKTSFVESYVYKHALTFHNNTIILLELKRISSNKFEVILFLTNPNNISGTINFEHQHCTLKPKPFILVSKKRVTVMLSQLPPCFKEDDELTVTLTTEE